MAATRAIGTSRKPSPSRAVPAVQPGRLIVVTCADPGLLDVMLKSVRRRSAGAAFVDPLTTRLLPAGGGIPVSRNAFAATERIGGLALSWRRGGQSCGHSITLLARLAGGETVVAGIDADQVADARALWPDVRVIRLGTRIDQMRAGLSPRACLARLTGAWRHQHSIGRITSDSADAIVHDDGNPSETIRRLSEAISQLSTRAVVTSHPSAIVKAATASDARAPLRKPRRARPAGSRAARSQAVHPVVA